MREPLRVWLPLLLCGAVAAPAAGEAPSAAQKIAAEAPGSDIYVASLEHGADGIRLGKPRNVTARAGYDNQPFFLADGRRFYYTSIRADAQADIWRHDLQSGEQRRITRTPESEYSPTVPPDGTGITTVRVERDGRQRLWRYDENGEPGKAIVEKETAVGYHAWIEEDVLALFIVGEPNVLKTYDLRSDRSREAGREIGRSLQSVPERPGVAYLEPQGDSVWLKLLMWPSGLTRLVTPPLEGSEDFVLGSDGELYMARDQAIYLWAREPGKWNVIADFAEELPGKISRVALNKQADTLAFVVAETP